MINELINLNKKNLINNLILHIKKKLKIKSKYKMDEIEKLVIIKIYKQLKANEIENFKIDGANEIKLLPWYKKI